MTGIDGALQLAVILIVGVLGLAVGSFLNVVVWRVPRGESVVHPPSACPTCGSAIRARDNVPVLSWLALRGRCRDCRERISARYPLVEAATGVLFVALAVRFGLDGPIVAALPAFLFLGAIAVALALIDLDTHRLPNAIVLPAYPVALALLGAATAFIGDWSALLRSLIGGAALFAFYFILAVAVPRGMGFGDVKLAGLIGGMLGWLSYPALLVGAFTAFVLGGVAGIAVIASRRGTGKTPLPFGPFMLAAAAVALWLAQPILDSYLDLTGL